jgi:ribonuclease E
VREKVSFLVNAQPDAAAPVNRSPPEPPAAPAESGSETTDPQPRRAGWWSRRFGSGE